MAHLRIYACSISATSQLHPAAPKGGTIFEHVAAMVPAETIQEAAELARREALQRWPSEDEAAWYNHQAAVLPADSQFYVRFFEALRAGIVDFECENAEPGQTFRFDRSLKIGN